MSTPEVTFGHAAGRYERLGGGRGEGCHGWIQILRVLPVVEVVRARADFGFPGCVHAVGRLCCAEPVLNDVFGGLARRTRPAQQTFCYVFPPRGRKRSCRAVGQRAKPSDAMLAVLLFHVTLHLKFYRDGYPSFRSMLNRSTNGRMLREYSSVEPGHCVRKRRENFLAFVMDSWPETHNEADLCPNGVGPLSRPLWANAPSLGGNQLLRNRSNPDYSHNRGEPRLRRFRFG